MNAPPPSLPRNLPPPVAAASLAATLNAARRRRVHRQARQVSAAVILGCAAALGLQSMGGTPSGAGAGAGGAFAQKNGAHSPGAPVSPERSHRPDKSYRTYLSAAPSPPESPAPVPAFSHPAPPDKPASSFVLVRTRSMEIVYTRPEPAAASTLPPGSPELLVVSTDSVPSPLIITTARTVAPQSIATGDNPQSPGTASDAELFALADGRPAALCRLASGDAHWFWLDQPPRP
ncbi:MAG: hypothetical protein V4726_11260 [Verrucomicrobiota bacterium]